MPVWGSVAVQPCAMSRENTEREGIKWERSIETVQGQGKEKLRLHAVSAVLMDGVSGRILYGKEEQSFRPMASTTKIMTCILALENGNPEDICRFSSKAAAQPKVHLGAPAGTQFRLQELLYSLMLESHNDSAVAIAEQIGGSVEGFASMMNQKARDIGCKNTWFITPNGLDAVCAMPDGGEKKPRDNGGGAGSDSQVLYSGFSQKGCVSGNYQNIRKNHYRLFWPIFSLLRKP